LKKVGAIAHGRRLYLTSHFRFSPDSANFSGARRWQLSGYTGRANAVATWIRSNIKCVSRIALLALAIQFALSFGHFHASAYAATPASEFGSALSKFSLAGSLTAQVADTRSARQPGSNHDSGEHPRDICAICVIMAMANAALFATPPSLPLPQIVEFSRLATQAKFACVASASAAFQPRAPPIS
jgi:hypothetical protein